MNTINRTKKYIDLTISMASYNGCQITREALKSIEMETKNIEYEVIVVDNASTDDTVDMITKEFPWVKLIVNAKNMGFAAAHNRALMEANGMYLLVLNNDILFVNRTAEKMIERLSSFENAFGIIGPRIINLDGSTIHSCRRKMFYPKLLVLISAINQLFTFSWIIPIKIIRRRFGKLFGKIHDSFNPPKTLEEVEWLDGMCVMFRREVLEEVGLFDEQFFFDYEIGDILIRAREKGWRILYDPSITLIHIGKASRKKNPEIVIESYRSLLIFYAKHKNDYIRILKQVNIVLFWIKIKIFKVAKMIYKNKSGIEDKIKTMEQILNLIKTFNAKELRNTERIKYI